LLKLVGAAAIALVDFVTPLFQINFFPDLMHVYVLLDTTDVMPALLQDAPALAAALAGMKGVDMKRESIEKNAINFLFIASQFFQP
jgi:hypothetical protein